MLTATDEGGTSFDPIESGLHHAICTAVFDLGIQFNEKFNKKIHKVLIQWELPDQRIEIKDKDTGEIKDMPRATSKQYTLSLHEKANLRKDLESWRGKEFTEAELKGFDILTLLGVNCLIQIIHKTTSKGTFGNISSILPLQKDTPKKEAENPLRSFSFEDNEEIPEGTPQWIRDIIGNAEKEVQSIGEDSRMNEEIPEEAYDDVPF